MCGGGGGGGDTKWTSGETTCFCPGHSQGYTGSWEILLNKIEIEVYVCDNPGKLILLVIISILTWDYNHYIMFF